MEMHSCKRKLEISRTQSGLVSLSSVLLCNALISDHPEGLTPGTYRGIALDLLTFVANFWPGTGALDHSCTSEARFMGKDLRNF